ncbi:hypothetical protein [Streptomyces sparsogenes]|uniref:Putative integral membrane protein n=1 Tax=Streptomyces sparsogenes DSM 40356 TaxID=1331668 RepID=A0A1R1SS35_9ACTN|nr:putative integral membrane protein [Streptomyces sparsogenes DSM 40356]
MDSSGTPPSEPPSEPPSGSPSEPPSGSPSGVPSQPPLNAVERQEYERLRKAAAVRHRRLRYAAASVLLVLAVLLAPLAVVATWTHEEVADTDRYVQTVAPLASEPAVQNAVTDRLTKRVVDNVDVAGLTAALSRALDRVGAPPRVADSARLLTGPLKTALTTGVHDVVAKVVRSDQFAQVWTAANRRAHAAVVKVLTGEGPSAVQARGNTVVLDIGTLIDNVKRRLVQAGYEKAAKIPTVERTVPLLRVEKLDKAQNAMRLLDVLGLWLPVAAIVLAALAVWTAPAHRVALMSVGVGVAVMMLVLLVGLAVMRQVYLGSVPPTTLPADAAATIYDTFVRFLRESTRTILVIAVITVVSGYLYGPARRPRRALGGRPRHRRHRPGAGPHRCAHGWYGPLAGRPPRLDHRGRHHRRRARPRPVEPPHPGVRGARAGRGRPRPGAARHPRVGGGRTSREPLIGGGEPLIGGGGSGEPARPSEVAAWNAGGRR